MSIVQGIVYLLFMLTIGFALFGWGTLWAGGTLLALRVIVGLATLLFFGGIVNLLGLAYGLSLNLFVAAGLCLGVRRVYLDVGTHFLDSLWRRLQTATFWWGSASFLIVYWLLAATVMVPEAYNYHDDLQKYFIYPVKMLATGSMYGSPLTALGVETFGGQALLQALFVHNLGLEGMNAFDSTFCLLLSCLLLIEYGVRRRATNLGLLAALLLFLIYPQYVNVSAHFSFVLFASATIFVAADIARDSPNAAHLNRLALLLGVMYGSAVTFKTTYVMFPLVHFPLFLLSLTILRVPAPALMRLTAIAIGSGLLTAGFWLIEPMILLAKHCTVADCLRQLSDVSLRYDFLRLLSAKTLFYGGTVLQYTSLVLVSVIGTILLAANRAVADQTRRTPEFPTVLSATLFLLVLYTYLTLFVADRLISFETSIRYSMPFVAAIIPPAILLTLCRLRESGQKASFVAVVCLTILTLLLQPSASIKGWKQGIECGSNLSFSELACSGRYRDYNNAALGEYGAGQVRLWQSKVPAGEPIVAWINNGYHLDFERNPIIEVDRAGINNPWAHFPDARYVMIESGGYATVKRDMLKAMAQNDYLYHRNIWKSVLNFMDYMEENIHIEVVLHSDEQVGVFRVGPPEKPFRNNRSR